MDVILTILQARYWANKAFDEQQISTVHSQDSNTSVLKDSVVPTSAAEAVATASVAVTGTSMKAFLEHPSHSQRHARTQQVPDKSDLDMAPIAAASASGTENINVSLPTSADEALPNEPKGPSMALLRRSGHADSFTEQEKEDFKEVFALFDANKSGTIETVELNTIMRRLGQDYTDEEIESLVTRIGLEKKQSITSEGRLP